MNNKFALSFGISLIFVGILNFFLETNYSTLFIVSVCTAIFSGINYITSQIDEDRFEYLYIIPFVLLISFLCFDEALLNCDFIKNIVYSRVTVVLPFLSFGLLFVTEYLKHKEEVLKRKINELKLIVKDGEYSSMIMALISNYMSELVAKEKQYDDETKALLDSIQELCDEKIKLSNINSSLIELNVEKYDLDDFNKVYKEYNAKINYVEIMKESSEKRKNAKKILKKKKEKTEK